jgi:hypothetical protein
VLDDVRSGRRSPGQGVRQAWLVPPVALGALAVPAGLAFELSGSRPETGWWSLAGAGLYLVVSLVLRAGSVTAVSYALLVVAVGTLRPSRDRSAVGGRSGKPPRGRLGGRVPTRSRAAGPWVSWDLAPL